MMSPFSFKGRIERGPYAAWSAGVFFSQYLVLLVPIINGETLWSANGWIYLVPHRVLATVIGTAELLAILGAAYLLLVAWALAALAFRRATDASIGGWIAVFAVAPFIQIPVILYLCFAPQKASELSTVFDDVVPWDAASLWRGALLGVFAGVGLTLVAVAISTLAFRTYGYGLFLLTPFVVGTIAGYVANRETDIGMGRTMGSAAIAVLLGSLVLVAAAIEGVICILMAAPLGLGMALIGGVLGRAMALQGRRPAGQTLPCLALLPLMFAVENVLPPVAHLDTEQTIEVAAPPDVVWASILSTDPIEGPLALPFRLGVAYPLRGEFRGEGVGAERIGVFSTGTAIERVTEWVPNRKLAFVVVRDIPAMRELSPYENVHAPHVLGYFRTTYTSFELVPRADGGTDIVERTSHELRIDPVPYWLPMARWIVRQNNARVLEHIRSHAERGAPS
jgi:uncharacterized membrane protein YhaH (DUF805 family)